MRQIKTSSFVTRTVTVVGEKDSSVLHSGVEDINHLETALKEISQCKALIAYLREGIKAKDALLQEVKAYVSQEQIDFGAKRPHLDKFLQEKDVVDSWPLEKRVRYYNLEAYAAVYGKAIHPDGELSKQRETFHNSLAGQSELKAYVNQILIYKNIPTIGVKDLEDFYFDLQKKYREYQASLNSLKTEIDNAITVHNAKLESDHQVAYDKWNRDYQDIVNRDNLFRNQEVARVSSLKIIIPENLKEIVSKIENL